MAQSKNWSWMLLVLLALVPLSVVRGQMQGDPLGQALQQRMIWAAPDNTARHTAFTAFRKTFPLAALPAEARLHLFADVRYLLWINGQYVGRGPCRFDPKGPEYDSIDVRRQLHAGANTLVVAVMAWGSNGKMMHHAPGLTAQLEMAGADGTRTTLGTDATWKWSAKTHYLPPAVGWGNVEDHIDMRQDDGDWTQAEFDDTAWAPAVAVNGAAWGPLSARRIPLLRQTPLAPRWAGAVKFPATLGAGQEIHFELEHLVQASTALEWEAEAGSEVVLTHANVHIISRGGVQRYITSDTHGFMRGAIQVKSGKVTLRAVDLVEVIYPFDCAGSFQCDDPMLNRLWKLCARSVQVMSEDAYVDCCDRERTEWMDCDPPAFDMTRVALTGPGTGDAKVYADARLLKEMVRRTALSLQPEGWVKAHTCSDRFDIHAKMEDRACDWVEGIRRYYESTHDDSVVREVWPAVVAQMHWFLERRTPRGLVHAREWVVWGNPMGYQTCEGAGLNAFIYKALVDAAYLGGLIGQEKQATEFAAAAKDLGAAFNRILWDEAEGTYFSGYYDAAAKGPEVESRHAHKLGLKVENNLVAPTWFPALFALDQEIVPADRQPRVRQYLLANCGPGGDVMSVYYLFKQMYIQDEARWDQKVLDLTRQRWAAMSTWEQQTSWEGFGGGSKAHIYGLFPGYFLSTYVLGVQLDGPVWNKRLVIQPRLGNLKFAQGVVVTELGAVPVSWKKAEGKLAFEFTVPEGVAGALRLAVAGADAHLVLDGQPATGRHAGRSLTVDVAAGAHGGTIDLPPESPAEEPTGDAPVKALLDLPGLSVTAKTSSDSAAAFESDVSKTSLIAVGQPSLNAVEEGTPAHEGGGANADAVHNGTTKNGAGGAETLNDGKTFRGYGPGTLTFRLNTVPAPRGYDITRILTFAGHNDSRASQNYTVSLALASDPAKFIKLGTATVACSGGSSEIQWIGKSGAVLDAGKGCRATGVVAIRFDFEGRAKGGFDVYRELCVVGTPTAP